MIEEMTKTSEEMLLKAGFTNVGSYRTSPGNVKWELQEWVMIKNFCFKTNEIKCMTSKILFITDGSCMTSSGCQNPSLTYMALTASMPLCH
jgi:hypothetical protein